MGSDYLLRIDNIKKNYFSSKTGKKIRALKGVCLDIYAGEILSLLGFNGAGKTTLSSIISTLHPPTKGEVLFQGSSIYTDIYQYRRFIGYCPQYSNIDEMLTIKQNLFFLFL